MPASVEFDIIAFQAKVLSEIERIQRLRDKGEGFYREPPFPKSSQSKSGRPGCLSGIALSLLMTFMRFMSRKTYQGLKEKREALTARAETLAEQEEVRQHLCPALQNIGDDPFEIAKTVTPLLVSLATVEPVGLPLEADLFAMLALVIAKRGTSNYCSGLYGGESQRI